MDFLNSRESSSVIYNDIRPYKKIPIICKDTDREFTTTVNESELSRYYVHFRKNTMCKNVGFGASDILVGYYYTYKKNTWAVFVQCVPYFHGISTYRIALHKDCTLSFSFLRTHVLLFFLFISFDFNGSWL